jgi:nitrite reductase/ring-hydroxylating ferredoxin subunit
MGGRLMAKNHIGVDTKYAGNTRWSEITVGGDGDVVAAADELRVDQMKLVRMPGRRVVLGRTENGYVAFDDHCTHRGASLAGGVLLCGTVQCPWHGSQFDVVTGQVRCGPAAEPIAVYRVEEADGKLRLYLS